MFLSPGGQNSTRPRPEVKGLPQGGLDLEGGLGSWRGSPGHSSLVALCVEWVGKAVKGRWQAG